MGGGSSGGGGASAAPASAVMASFSMSAPLSSTGKGIDASAFMASAAIHHPPLLAGAGGAGLGGGGGGSGGGASASAFQAGGGGSGGGGSAAIAPASVAKSATSTEEFINSLCKDLGFSRTISGAFATIEKDGKKEKLLKDSCDSIFPFSQKGYLTEDVKTKIRALPINQISVLLTSLEMQFRTISDPVRQNKAINLVLTETFDKPGLSSGFADAAMASAAIHHPPLLAGDGGAGLGGGGGGSGAPSMAPLGKRPRAADDLAETPVPKEKKPSGAPPSPSPMEPSAKKGGQGDDRDKGGGKGGGGGGGMLV